MARLRYGGGGDWYTGPTMLPNLHRRLGRDLGIRTCPGEKTVSLQDAALFSHPILFMTGHGAVEFSREERRVLREYLERGGLLFADDNYGLAASFRREMALVFPGSPWRELPPSHPLFKSHHRFPQGLPKVHVHDGKPPQAFGIARGGRLVVLFTYQSDLGNGWEDAEVHGDPPAVREAALKMGVNVIAWYLQGQAIR